MKSFLINYCWLAATQMLAKKKKKKKEGAEGRK